MANDVWGWGGGAIAAEESTARVNSENMRTLHQLGEIEKQPLERARIEGQTRLDAAHAEEYRMLAAGHAAKLAAQKQLDELNAAFVQEERTREQQKAQAAATAYAEGRVPTVADVVVPGQPAVSSQTYRLQKFLEFAERKGVPESTLTPYRKELSSITKEEAVTAYDLARAEQQNNMVSKEQAERRAAWAAGVLQNPKGYQQALQEALASNDPALKEMARKLPQIPDPATGQVLERMRRQGIEASKQAEITIKQQEADRKGKLEIAQEAHAGQRTALAKERTRVEKIKADILEKFGGANAEATVDQKKVTTEARKDERAAKTEERYPKMPLLEKDRKPERTYTLPDGSRWTWRKNPNTGKMDWWRPSGVTADEILKQRATADSEEE